MEERRKGKRFQVDWPVKIEGTSEEGASFTETGIAENISSGGALLRLANAVPVGAKLEVHIQLPLNKNKWMKYTARIVRVEDESPEFIAVKFDSTKPLFAES
ncbi:MAG TPA: PilZ domain-containing protein [Blastocatellia bacterium]|nr:PilZ domain-containing protein [Blastocatellia bacterium]